MTKTPLHAEVDIPATIPLNETALPAEAVIAATQNMENTMRAVFLLKFDAQSMAVPCTDRIGARQLLLHASELLSSSNVFLKKVFVLDDGRKLKCMISEMPSLLESQLLSELAGIVRPKGFVKKCDDSDCAEDEEHGQRMRRRAEAVGDIKAVRGFLGRMVTLHGEGGTGKKKRRLARSAVQCYTVAHRVESCGLREAAENDNVSDYKIGHA